MTKELMKKETFDIKTIDNDLYSALKNSVYPGAKDSSIAMVLSYCKARQLDPLQKPVHIVPMFVKEAGTDKGSYRDVVMPGIGLYRIQAQRSGAYAGQSEPEFGEDITEILGNVTITYPKWCKITVKKLMPSGQVVEYSAKELWKENYATAGKENPVAPNAMWKKRPYAQLAKCTEAQALRKAFPDILDQSPTAEEMEGKHHEDEVLLKKKVDQLNDRINSEIIEGQVFDPETGEVTQTEVPIDPNAPSFDEVKKQMENAANVEELIFAKDLARSLNFNPIQIDELAKLFKQQQVKLKA